ncbi:MAG: hypothetical protein WD185_04135 [Sneathiella sp.]
MKRVWILLGNANVKKSAVIRALTGTSNASIKKNYLCQIERTDGLIFSLVPYTGAMQEEPKVEPEAMADHFESSKCVEIPKTSDAIPVQDGFIFPEVRNFLFCLRNDSKAICYIKVLLRRSWNIEAIITLGEEAPSWLQHSGIRYAAIPNAQKLPGSVVAYKVRDYFQWK